MEGQAGPSRADKRKFDRDPELKDKAMNVLVHFAELLMAKSGIRAGDIVNGMKVSNLLHQTLTFLRQRANGPSTIIQSYLSTTHKFGALELSLEQSAVLLTKVAGIHGLAVTPKSEWIAAVLPTITYSSCFKDRLKELRLGHTEFVVKPAKGNVPEVKREISSYGLNANHAIFLSGIRVTPLKRSAIAMSLGPLTQIYCLRNAILPDKSYHVKWESVLLSTFAHFPFKTGLIRVLKTCTASELCSIFPLIGDILLMTGSRQSHKLALPIGALTGYMSNQDRLSMEREFDAIAAAPVGATIQASVYKPRKVASTGKKGVLTYNAFMRGKSIRWREETDEPPAKKPKPSKSGPGAEMEVEDQEGAAGPSSPKKEKPKDGKKELMAELIESGEKPTFYPIVGAGQVVFMCVFDTYKEDLGLQQWMCGETEKWLRRNELTDLKELAKKEGTAQAFTPKLVQYYSKPSSANQGQFFRTSSQQVSTTPCFSGRYSQKASKLLAYLEEFSNVETGAEEKVPAMRAMLLKLRETLKAKVAESGGRLSWGNTDWHVVGQRNVDMTKPVNAPECSEDFFLAPRDIVG